MTLTRDGRVVFYNGAQDIGQGSSTVLVQILADALGLPVERIETVVADTDLTADAGKSSASRQTFVSGRATQLAGEARLQSPLSVRVQLTAVGSVVETSAPFIGAVMRV